VFLGLIAVLYTLQTAIIFPGASTKGDPAAIVSPSPGAELVRLTTARGERVVALFGPALNRDGMPRADAAHCPTILFFYGNAMCLRASEGLFGDFRRLGANVMIPDYIGFGMSEGSASEVGCYDTADASYDYLQRLSGVDATKIVAAGWSLGGAVAVDLAARRKVAGLAVFSTFTSGVDLGRRLFPFVPVSLLLRHRFESLGKIGSVACPVLIGHGRLDSIVPYEMSEKLAAAAKSPVVRYTLDDADHNDFFDVDSARTADELRRFLALVALGGNPSP
jgi:fermentation-respiration switch protein FrsA (DUF1100 family)